MRKWIVSVLRMLGLAIALPLGLAFAEGESKCPVMPEEPIDPAISVEYQGRRVYFCCQKCRKKFLEDPESYAANLPPAPTSPQAGKTPSPQQAPVKPGGIRRLAGFAGRFHPAVAHFPIALLVAAALAEALLFRTGKALFSEAARYCLWLAAPAALLAAALGWAAGFSQGHPRLEKVFSLHKWLGTGVAALALATWVFSEMWRRGNKGARRFYQTSLFCGAALVLASGALGGVLVYGWEHYRW